MHHCLGQTTANLVLILILLFVSRPLKGDQDYGSEYVFKDPVVKIQIKKTLRLKCGAGVPFQNKKARQTIFATECRMSFKGKRMPDLPAEIYASVIGPKIENLTIAASSSEITCRANAGENYNHDDIPGGPEWLPWFELNCESKGVRFAISISGTLSPSVKELTKASGGLIRYSRGFLKDDLKQRSMPSKR